MSEEIRVRLRNGDREVEVQAPSNLAEQLLERWWSASQSPPTDEPSGSLDRKNRRRKGPARSSKRPATEPNAQNGDGFDAQALVNNIRADPQWSVFQTKILDPKDRLNKVKLICWHAKQPLTSGQIQKVLDGLDVKIDPSGVSKAIKRELNSFKQSGARKRGTQVRYELVGRASTAFEKLLNEQS